MRKSSLLATTASILFLSAGSVHADETFRLTMGMSEAPDSPSHMAAERISELAAERSDGRLQIDVHPGGALGSVSSMIEGTTTGSIDLYWGGISWYENFNPDFKIFSIGWGFQNEDHMLRFMDTDRFEEMKENLRETRNLRMISHHGLRSPRRLICTVPVESPDDLDGVRVRVPDQPIYLQTWEAVGADPVRIDYGEAYLALQQGIADCVENPIEGLYAMSFYEQTDYLMYTDHLLNPYTVVVNEQTFQELGEELQEILIQAALEGSEYYVSIRDEEEATALSQMEEAGIEVIRPDLQPFAERSRELARELEADGEWTEGLFDYVFDLASES
ncbi:TRAP transporter substrate-binding protein [Fodinicurvata sp. EGI_FJ10296]|uniref:TRAP transporter substrate-binding protein n=1 Tax=Fodinicurvata sp. EGI_FJ10296 TaxID=3231908 RepID=UPI00345693CD